ncbi:hypothetical protein PN498_26090 [Oscillatoria sp. CS-180]|uniref:hypothetical protein n=1 Tax=Oscillatoria sp. CS-180 TaxID=3021720 RepID=UPI00232D6C23|nr:hypothetical protein [Oscillatoria sp. CS-180]MDB9529488.1 hypothetical protein [Oscillatoria sp. CS-180]
MKIVTSTQVERSHVGNRVSDHTADRGTEGCEDSRPLGWSRSRLLVEGRAIGCCTWMVDGSDVAYSSVE